jgi:hypothetical protein
MINYEELDQRVNDSLLIVANRSLGTLFRVNVTIIIDWYDKPAQIAYITRQAYHAAAVLHAQTCTQADFPEAGIVKIEAILEHE